MADSSFNRYSLLAAIPQERAKMAIYSSTGNKIRRNSPCPCGSGRKFKHCHRKMLTPNELDIVGEVAESLSQHLMQVQARQSEFQRDHGKGRPIISSQFRDWRLVAVGNELNYAKKTDTKYFADFLLQYIRLKLGVEWGMSELAKPLRDRHPVLQWYDGLCRFQRSEQPDDDGIYRSSGNGALLSWYRLAYDLYVTKHNADLQERLLHRIRNAQQFQGARFELVVTASMILAGFEITFEDESDTNRKHAEFVATHLSGMRIAVEAKSRHRDGVLEYKASPRRSGQNQSSRVSVERLIRKALPIDNPRHPLPDRHMIMHVAQSIIKRNNIPNEFPEQEILA